MALIVRTPVLSDGTWGLCRDASVALWLLPGRTLHGLRPCRRRPSSRRRDLAGAVHLSLGRQAFALPARRPPCEAVSARRLLGCRGGRDLAGAVHLFLGRQAFALPARRPPREA